MSPRGMRWALSSGRRLWALSWRLLASNTVQRDVQQRDHEDGGAAEEAQLIHDHGVDHVGVGRGDYGVALRDLEERLAEALAEQPAIRLGEHGLGDLVRLAVHEIGAEGVQPGL